VDQGVFNVNANSTPDARNRDGTAAGLTNRGLPFGGPAMCLRVEGTHATIGTSTFALLGRAPHANAPQHRTGTRDAPPVQARPE
jgi:hypothetical protein